ncbi:MAG: hypothetical protein IAE83_12700 [Anaerolinea sp.]|nr:hypothetical protein [Anaerolinea sp.]MCC6973092.1 hypothetical protein [Anaerolineae bacterium]
MTRKYWLWLMTVFLIVFVSVPVAPMTRALQDDNCAGLPETRLADGALAKVISANSDKTPGAYFKPTPSRQGPVLRYIPEGSVVKITGEFQCSFEGERWWAVELADLKGWMTESSGLDYVLEPFEGDPPAPLPSTVIKVAACIQPNVQTEPLPTPSTETGGAFRAVFAGPDGSLNYSDNLGPARTVALFNPPPLSVDLSPDGTAALVVTYNGIYWVELLTGQTVLMADATTFGLAQESYPRRATWIPGTNQAAVEIEDTRDDVVSYPLWNLPLDGLTQPFQLDRGNQPRDGVRRNPQRTSAILISANDILLYPANINDEPPPLLEFVPRLGIGDARALLSPAISWAEKGDSFYTYIQKSDEAPPDDPVAGRLWHVTLEGEAENMGAPSGIEDGEYVIPSPDGKMLLIGLGSTWRIQNPSTGQVVRELPPLQYLFNWTPDSKGVVYTTREAKIAYMGIDGDSVSAYVPPAADNLYEIQWLPDGTTLFAVRGRDGKLSFSVQPTEKEPVFIGLVSTVNAFAGQYFAAAPGLGKVPEVCR